MKSSSRDINVAVDAKLFSVLPVGIDGSPCVVSQTGEPYEEFRPFAVVGAGADVDEAATEVAKQLVDDVARYLKSRRGEVYWRIRPHVEAQRGARNTIWVRAYARVLKSNKPITASH